MPPTMIGGRSVSGGSVFGWSPAPIKVSRSITICTASVAKIMTNMVAFRVHNGRTTSRSMTTPSAATITVASTADARSGSPNCWKATWVSMPPSITNAPCAKFTMPLAL